MALIIIGLLFLVNNTGVLPKLFWAYTLTYWPILLIGVGISLVFQRSGGAILLLSFIAMLVLGYITARGLIAAPWHHMPQFR